MTTAKHTPGPWHAEIVPADRFGPAYFRRVVDGNGDTIRLHGVALSSGDEAEANARLIAAAPELLAALKDAMRSTRKDFKLGPDGDRQHREGWAEQFAAIAKAEGTP